MVITKSSRGSSNSPHVACGLALALAPAALRASASMAVEPAMLVPGARRNPARARPPLLGASPLAKLLAAPEVRCALFRRALRPIRLPPPGAALPHPWSAPPRGGHFTRVSAPPTPKMATSLTPLSSPTPQLSSLCPAPRPARAC